MPRVKRTSERQRSEPHAGLSLLITVHRQHSARPVMTNSPLPGDLLPLRHCVQRSEPASSFIICHLTSAQRFLIHKVPSDIILRTLPLTPRGRNIYQWGHGASVARTSNSNTTSGPTIGPPSTCPMSAGRTGGPQRWPCNLPLDFYHSVPGG